MTYMIYPYSSASAGAKDLAAALDGYRIKLSNSTYKYSEGDVIINWGSSGNPYKQALNANIKDILSKRAFFERLKYTGLTPRFALDPVSAKMLNCNLFCRQKDQGKDGDGIVVWTQTGDVPDAKLYVEMVDKTSEYRVHVGRTKDGEIVVIGQQRKYFSGVGPVWAGDQCKFVWTVDGSNVVLPGAVTAAAMKTMECFPEITFAGLDIVYNSSNSTAYVLEANSAPTMTPKSIEKYTTFFNKYYPLPVVEQAPVPSTPVAGVFTPAAPVNSVGYAANNDPVLSQIKNLINTVLTPEQAKAWAQKEFA